MIQGKEDSYRMDRFQVLALLSVVLWTSRELLMLAKAVFINLGQRIYIKLHIIVFLSQKLKSPSTKYVYKMW